MPFNYLFKRSFSHAQGGPQPRSPRVDAFFFLLLGSVVIAVPLWLACASLPLHADAATALYAARLLLAGNGLAAGFAPGLPSSWCHLLLPAAWAAQALHIAPVAAFFGYTLVLASLSLVLCRTLLWHLMPDATHILRQGALFFLAFALLGYPAAVRDFGQPAHVMTILAMPWFLALGARGMGVVLPRCVAWPSGLLAGAAFLIEPHALVLWLGGECVAALAARRHNRLALYVLRPEAVAVPCMLALYSLGLVLKGSPFASALPVPLPSPWRFAALANDPGMVVWLAGDLVSCFLLSRLQPSLPGLAALVPLLPVMVLPVFFPHTTWTHPGMAGGCAALFVACTAVFALHASQTARRARRPGPALLLLGLMATAFGIGQWSVMHNVLNQVTAGETTLAGASATLAPHKPLYVISTRPYPAFGLVLENDSCWPGRQASLAALPAFYADMSPKSPIAVHAPEAMPPLEKALFTSVVDDLLASPPALIIFDMTSPQPGFNGHAFNYLGYFSQDPRFAALLHGYTAVIPPIANYLLMRRLPGQPVGLCPGQSTDAPPKTQDAAADGQGPA